jgi:hypothetical protein
MVERNATRICPGCFAETPLANPCSRCGHDATETPYPQALQPGTSLDTHFVVGKVLGKPGGFGITYLAWDNTLETRVAIKEFLPSDLVGRHRDHLTVVPHSTEERNIFQTGLQSFLQEARTLARFNHPNIVRVRHYFQENDTAYMVMDYYQGQSLWEHLEQGTQALSEARALEIMLPVLDGLREIHSHGFVHRDIKPQNIYLTVDGRAILLDFGAARNAISEKSRSLSVVWTPGFAPFEQYQSRGKQGPWTDVYGASATLYFMLTRRVPPDALQRKAGAATLSFVSMSEQLTSAISRGLAVDWQKRPQTIQEFRDLLPGPEDGGSAPSGNGGSKAAVRPDRDSAGMGAAMGWSLAWFAAFAALTFVAVREVLLSSVTGPSGGDVVPAALAISALSTLGYGLAVYVMYRIGSKFAIGSFPAFAIPVYNYVLLCRCGGLSGWFLLLLLVPFIGQLAFHVGLYGSIARRLGKSFWLYGFGSLLLIPILVLAFDDSTPDYAVPGAAEPADGLGPPGASAGPVVLHFLSGDFQGERMIVPPEGLTIGRNPAAVNIVFQDSAVSGRHLRIFAPTGTGTLRIEDLGSTNGTYFSYASPPTTWTPLQGTLEESEGRPVWIRLSEHGPMIKLA